VLQSPAFRISVVVIPESAAAEDEAPLEECTMNKVTSILDIFMTYFNHLAMVQNAIRLCNG